MCNALSWTTKSRSFSWQGGTSLGLASKVSSVTEMILSAPILRSWWHLGQAAICVAGELKLASATTFTGVPHLRPHNATSLAICLPQLLHKGGDCTPATRRFNERYRPTSFVSKLKSPPTNHYRKPAPVQRRH